MMRWIGICLLIGQTIVAAEPSKLTARQKFAALQEAKRLGERAEVQDKQGKFNDAERAAGRALVLEEKVRGPWHIEIANRLDHLAELYVAHGKESAAEPLQERARSIRERALSTHPDSYEREGGEVRVRRNQPAEKASGPLP